MLDRSSNLGAGDPRALFTGIVPMQITPFCPNGSVDVNGLAKVLEWQLQLGVSAVSALGMAGEFYKLTTNEIETVISCIVDCAGTLKTLIGVTAPSADIAARLARHAERAGADALLVMPPYVIRPSRDELVHYYGAIARAADLPILVQDGSAELRAVIPFDDLVHLCREVSSIFSIKVEDALPRAKIARLSSALGDRVTLLCGNSGLDLLPLYECGACGCISGAGTADILIQIDGASQAGNRDSAQRRYLEALPLLHFQSQTIEFFIATEKAILARRGLIEHDAIRRPGERLDEVDRRELAVLCDQLGITTASGALSHTS